MAALKYLVESFVENLTLEELRRFRKLVLIRQGVKNLLEAADEAEQVLIKDEISVKKIVIQGKTPTKLHI